MQAYFLGDQCLIFSFGNEISKALNIKVLSVYYTILKNSHFMEKWSIVDLVPSYNALAFYFLNLKKDNYQNVAKDAKKLIQSILKNNDNTLLKDNAHWQIDVSYTGSDLALVSKYTNLSEKEVIKCHKQQTYQIAMLGFVPFFPYLIGLDPKLEVPRRERPRVRVKKGSVALAGKQAGIYSQSSPGGWNIIGVTDFDLFESLKPGDTLEFNEV